jgi:hypothetical protein
VYGVEPLLDGIIETLVLFLFCGSSQCGRLPRSLLCCIGCLFALGVSPLLALPCTLPSTPLLPWPIGMSMGLLCLSPFESPSSLVRHTFLVLSSWLVSGAVAGHIEALLHMLLVQPPPVPFRCCCCPALGSYVAVFWHLKHCFSWH